MIINVVTHLRRRRAGLSEGPPMLLFCLLLFLLCASVSLFSGLLKSFFSALATLLSFARADMLIFVLVVGGGGVLCC